MLLHLEPVALNLLEVLPHEDSIEFGRRGRAGLRSQFITLSQEHDMKKGIVTLMLAATAAFAAGPTQTFTGVITDSMCGKSHKAMGVTPDSKCVRDCVHGDPSRYKYALYDGKSVYVLSDQQTPERFAGQTVTVKGVLDQNTHTIHVDAIIGAK
jgi:hypothetical protein